MIGAVTAVRRGIQPRTVAMARRANDLAQLREQLAAALASPKRVLVDCRQPCEVLANPLAADSVVTPMVRDDLRAVDQAVETGRIPADKETPIIVACAVGMRSAFAKRRLEDLGYTSVLNGVSPDVLNPLLRS